MGCRTEPATVHIAHVLQRLHFFQFFNFFYNFTGLTAKKITRPYRKNFFKPLSKKIKFFYNLHDLAQKKIKHICCKKIHD